jgi:hypothetical protein
MMTFTFITALFLPGTFIATLFSMDMFNWGDGRSGVSKNFWIYWVVAVPLTVAVMVGWKKWYGYADREFKGDTLEEEKLV